MRGANLIKTNRARSLRMNGTNAELRVWFRLRSRQIGGHKFVRQAPIGKFIVDFVCHEQRLIIELDGGQHAIGKRDAIRDKWLAEHGYRVLRFWNNEVFENIDGVLETIANALLVVSPPHPTSLRSVDLSPHAERGEARPVRCFASLPVSGER